jgi:chemotaxis signal transduction protein
LQRQRDIISKFENNIQQIYYDQEQYIIFELNKNQYALSIKNIKEIVKYKNINSISLPHTYDYIKGVFNFRGDFISILDFNIFLNMENTKSVVTDLSKLIVLDVKDFKLALFVDNIIDIITVTPNEIFSKFDDKFESKFVSSEIHINDKIISIISLEKILADKRLYIKD